MKNKIHNGIFAPFYSFFKRESAGGLVLLMCSIVAIIFVNCGFSQIYDSILHKNITIGYGEFSLSMSVLHWINDGLMTVFFFVVGMEIKRELTIGELKSIKRTILPVSGAIGGMILPAIIYVVFNYGKPTITGWAIPMATDIAFALGILSIAAKKVPKAIVVFLTALAIVDDLGAIVVIAIFYTDRISWIAFITGLIVLSILILANKFKIRALSLFIIGGLVLWVCFLKSGIHSTISGVLLGMIMPAGRDVEEFKTSMLYKFEYILTPWSSFLVMPMFALANSGIIIDINNFSMMMLSPVSLGIMCGLFIGKPVGIFGVSYILIKLGIVELSPQVTQKHLYGASVFGGIGFTMSLFISSLAFSDQIMLSTAKMSIMISSIMAGIFGTMVFKLTKY
ncbi:MAG: Na+/H+ antiporter NhaA [Clostridium sp.]|jgi:NhaA family Na+:H+ antiporter|uniref:Na+/H+ antiporter NhaA n=1 Tax=Clostridium sp. TaxID=1506 RepID=UPI0025BF36F8|nr:Na+/H+ antiporter NhaA [Clostridium sp.]MCH3965944.1 Na+/H+ antiporter NhaA [Clostridium sp.]MCI1715967.1 Na+/H+ antiporter NhaA [Clostridium sp.]MCI1800361.1 Na+/H+ antiporter NhaA [Clostridium sp.]MCI1814144.1 Na+/H+ antiporter NhaA [Clostridium sp.]MCI1871043.1 Na+/H+ antiporter NhaA [Clostridium sp.]